MENQEWHPRAEHQRLADKVEDLSDRLRELEITLHGKRAKTGLLAEYERHDQLLARLYAVIWQDPTGQKGILHDIDLLMGRKSSKEKSSQYKWQFWALVITAVISSVTTITLNWEKIQKHLPKHLPTPYEKKIEKAKRPKSQKKIYRYRIIKPVPTPAPEDKPSPDSM